MGFPLPLFSLRSVSSVTSVDFADGSVQDPMVCASAVEQGNGVDILGRPCRTEQGRVRRECIDPSLRLSGTDSTALAGTLFVVRRDGAPITTQDKEAILKIVQEIGSIETSWAPTSAECAEYRLPSGGSFVKFNYYQHCQDANQVRCSCYYQVPDFMLTMLLQTLRDDETYAFSVPTTIKQKIRPLSARGTRRFPAVGARSHQASKNFGEHGNAIYVGNLRTDVIKQDLLDIFHVHGTISRIELHSKPRPKGMSLINSSPTTLTHVQPSTLIRTPTSTLRATGPLRTPSFIL